VASWLVRSTPERAEGRGHCTVFLGKTLNSHSASTYLYPVFVLYKWLLVNLVLGGGGNPAISGLASHPGGSRNTPSRLMLLKLE